MPAIAEVAAPAPATASGAWIVASLEPFVGAR
jgi:hypothetical protein